LTDISSALNTPSLADRAALLQQILHTIDDTIFASIEGILQGNEKINLAIVASLFHTHTGMAPLHEELETKNQQLVEDLAKLTMQSKQNDARCLAAEERANALAAQVANLTTQLRVAEDRCCSAEARSTMFEDACKRLTSQNEIERSKRFDNDSRIGVLQDQLRNANLRSNSVQAEMSHITAKETAFSKSKQEDTLTIVGLKAKLQLMTEDRDNWASKHTDMSKEHAATLAFIRKIEKEHARTLATYKTTGNEHAEELNELKARQEKMNYLIEHLKIERALSEFHMARCRKLFNAFSNIQALVQAIYGGNLTIEELTKKCQKSGFLTKKGIIQLS